ncbi:MAG: hypothetical protein B6D39_10820 [Anaerolineae bacterium UTCFX2]|jgi:hypothetical protein|nr:DUF4332 domain-containing protein [Anaerolineales bacterium]OQY88770.1 MAG: hypothetical protein B6D39_10820 [Anaerolineae bacterium UTCFX2]
MKQKNSCGVTALLVVLAFVVGLILGLVVLGWGLWPVTWTGASPQALDSAAQQDYLRAAIDSYNLNQDASLAASRYEQLGSHGPVTIAAIYASPAPLSKQAVESFANAVNAKDALGDAPPQMQPSVPPQAAPSALRSWITAQPIWLALCLIGLFILLIVLLVIRLIARSRKKRTGARTAPQILVQDTTDEPAATEPPVQPAEEVEPASKTQPTLISQEPASQPEIEEIELPDWLRASTESAAEISAPVQPEFVARELSDQEIEEISASKFPFEEESALPSELAIFETETQLPAEQLRFPSKSKPEVGEPSQSLAHAVDETPAAFDSLEVSSVIEPASASQAVEAEARSIGEETPEETYQKFSSDLQSLPGLEADDIERLREAGITAPLLLLRNGSTAQGRTKLAEQTGIEESKLLEGVCFVDLLRIKGLSKRDALALKNANIDTLAKLASSDADTLFNLLQEEAASQSFEASLPSFESLTNWISQANHLPKVVV